NVFLIEVEQSGNDRMTARIDVSYLASQDSFDSLQERRKRIDEERVLFRDKQFIIQHPYGKVALSEITVEQAENYVATPLKDVLEVKMTDTSIVKACAEKYQDHWVPCDGACGDP